MVRAPGFPDWGLSEPAARCRHDRKLHHAAGTAQKGDRPDHQAGSSWAFCFAVSFVRTSL